ncbi:MAG TPA: hypothetical protein VMX57_07085, partial [Planctomycetota bacterium]|nr:hypothetical protein [Planctomycetota bacterium]
MPEPLLVDLAEEVNAFWRSPEMDRRKSLWVKLFRGERPAKPPVKVAPFMTWGYDLVWQRLIGEDRFRFKSGLARHLEVQLRKKLYKFGNFRDDDVVAPTVWVPAKEVTPADAMWGVQIRRTHPDEVGGAYKPVPVIVEESDLDRITLPHFERDRAADEAAIEEARELVDDRVPVKCYNRRISYAPYEVAVLLRGAEPLLYDVYDRPAFVHRLMDRLTDGMVQHEKEREAAGAFDVEEGTLLHEPWDVFPEGREQELAAAWVYLSAQSAAPLGPEMFAEFVQPYIDRLARLFAKVYYHGCEDLGGKIATLRDTPNLRHFHVSPWTALADVVPQLRGRKVAMEVHAHPTNVLFVWG